MTTDGLNALLKRWLAPVSDDLPEVYAVGGAVRDHLMGRPMSDVDLACRDAAGFARLLADCQDTPVTVVPFTRDPQAPCFRVVNSRRPGNYVDVVNLRGPSIEADLTLRDFTVNAMAFRIAPGGRTGELIDFLNGRRDISHGIIRMCTAESLSDDPLRVLRAARLAAGLDFTIAPETLTAMKRNAAGLTRIAPERIAAELLKLLEAPRALPHIRTLDETGALAVILPELTAAKGCEQNGYHHLDVWGHSLETLAACEEIIRDPDCAFGPASGAVRDMLKQDAHTPLLKLSALLHDAAKPLVKKPDPDKGRMIFHGHARLGADMATGVADRLRLSSAQSSLLYALVRQHMRPVILSQPDVKKSTVIKWFREMKDTALLVMVLSVADVTAKSGEKLTKEAKDRFFSWARQSVINYMESLKPAFARQNLITGTDLISLGMKPGPKLGKILNDLREKQDLGELSDREEALALAQAMITSPSTDPSA
ncbi:MAG: HD domain-containing protein [Thermodesulfobacteriota bacterium]